MTDESPWTPDEMLRRARGGEAQAFAALVRRYQRSVFSIALRMLSDRHKAEDLAQEVFMQLHRKLATIESDTHLALWLRKVTANRAIDRLRQEPKQDLLNLRDDTDIASDSTEADPLLQRQLGELVSRLPPAPRAVVLLRYQEDLDPVEIAATLDMSINTVKSHLKRSLTTLRSLLIGAAIVDSGAGAASRGVPISSREPST